MDANDGHGHVTLPARYVLAIGVKDYLAARKVRLSTLDSTSKDANDVGQILKSKAGFSYADILTPETITQNRNYPIPVRRTDILTHLDTLASEARKYWVANGHGAIVVVYFAGHGLSDDSEDYLLPADFDPRIAEDVQDMAVSITQILARLSYAHPALAVIISDACRNQISIPLDSLTDLS